MVLVQDVERPSPNSNNKNNNNNVQTTYRFYALDALCIEGGKIWHKPLEMRIRYLNESVLLPRKKDEGLQQQQKQANESVSTTPENMKNIFHDYTKERIKIRAHEYFPMKKIRYVMKEVCKGVGHEAKGIRIVPIGEYYSSSSLDTTRRSTGSGSNITLQERSSHEVLENNGMAFIYQWETKEEIDLFGKHFCIDE